jgi:hypothetical protein
MSDTTVITNTIEETDSAGDVRRYYVAPDGTRFPADELSKDATRALYEARLNNDVVSLTRANGTVQLCTVGRSMSRVVMLHPQGNPRGLTPGHPDVRSISVDGRKVYEDLEAFA